MRNSLRRLALILGILLALPMAVPAMAEGDWSRAYLKVLKQGANQKQLAALIDLSDDGVPELIVVSVDASKAATLKAYTASGSDAVPLSIGASFSLTSLKSASIKMRKNAAGTVAASISASGKLDGKAATQRIALTAASGNALAAPLIVTKSGKQYGVSGESTTKARYNKAIKAFDKAYSKKSTPASIAIAAGSSASTIETKAASLVKKRDALSTVNRIKLSQSSATLTVGESLVISATVSPATAAGRAISWKSSNTGVATVDDDGKVIAVSAGSANIVASTSNGVKQTLKLTVKADADQPGDSGVSLSDTSLTLVKGGTHTLSVKGASGELKWSSSAPTVATVNTSGKITALKAGKAVITVKMSNGKSASCKLVVNTTNAVIVDISQHNYSAKMDWAKIAKNVDLLILRCGVTRTYTAPIGVGIDAKFAYYAAQCKAYDIPFGVYFYGKCSDVETAKKEAQLTWETASPYDPLFYVYDVEESCLNKTLIETYMKTLQGLGAKKTGYYIAHHLYSKYKLDTSLVDFIWLPHYGKNTGSVNSTPSYACDIHQYSSKGTVPGFPGIVDVNRLMGTKSLSWFLS